MRLDLPLARLALTPWARALDRAAADPAAAQRAVHDRIVADLRQTAYGVEHGVRDALDTIPARTWDELGAWRARDEAGEPRVLTPHRALWREPTSGSSGPCKAVVHTAPLRAAFTAMAAAWAHDLLTHAGLRTGRFYASVSPRLGPRRDGTTDDTDYLSPALRPLARRYLVRSPTAERADDADTFWHALAADLLAADDLEVVSVWNPSFFTVLLDRLQADPPSSPRAAAARAGDWRAVWPRLRLVSAWADAHAEPTAQALAARLPGVVVQPKGLLCTEAPVTVPRWGLAGALPLWHHILLERLADDGTLTPLHAAREGDEGELVLSQRAGLVRYRVGDRIAVVGHHGRSPLIRLLGRVGGVSDLVGEKLHPAVVTRAFAEVLPAGTWACLIPKSSPHPHYVVRADRPLDHTTLHRLDVALRAAHHMELARALGQLGPPVAELRPNGRAEAIAAGAAAGARIGDVKDRVIGAVEP